MTSYSDEILLLGSTVYASGGTTIPALIEEHDKAQQYYIKLGTEYEAMGWSIFQALHTAAFRVLESGGTVLRKKLVSFEDVSEFYKENLASIEEQRGTNAT
ncbi:hypothetical protein A9404_04380 [Halothiobacillus diazotrophicus]|uniref:Uncharacterized protein n=2 Tax=Halothiobacillus diazotrophicus TaxID=1860122 RepID=A0A191ZFR8_9GAMM|nr:hypothetical protein A9404_04380 [Halothiobacillus diazotrophicus]